MLRWLGRLLVALLLIAVAALVAMVRFDLPAIELERRYATPPSTFVNAAGLRVHVRDRGQGPAVLLVHGSSSSLFTWEGWARDLERDHRVISLDLPGHGLTGPDARGRTTAPEMAEVVLAVADALGVERFSIAGSSMGGHVAIAVALAQPRRVDKLILVDAAGLPREEPRPFAFRLFATPGVGRVVRWVTPRFIVARSLREVYGDPSKVTDELIDRTDALVRRAGNREATRQRFARPDDGMLTARLGELQLPVLILWGSRDTWILPKYGERYRDRIAGAKLVVLDGLGHVPMEEDPAGTVKIAREFLDGR